MNALVDALALEIGSDTDERVYVHERERAHVHERGLIRAPPLFEKLRSDEATSPPDSCIRPGAPLSSRPRTAFLSLSGRARR